MRDIATRIQISGGLRSYYSVPAHREALAVNTGAAWADPVKRARMGRPRGHIDALTEPQRVEYRRLQRCGVTVPDILKRLGVKAG